MNLSEKFDATVYEKYGFDPRKEYHFQVDTTTLDSKEMGAFNRLRASGMNDFYGIADMHYTPRWLCINMNGDEVNRNTDASVAYGVFIMWLRKMNL